MLKEKLLRIHSALGEVLGHTRDEQDADLLRICRSNLQSAAEQAAELEEGLCITHETHTRETMGVDNGAYQA
ncbi:hypothetical protein [uncultured Desulfovibrio sp.]|uniref:hypothetical protein n=1 Tax=uncultured Desulfovibrio sp. TaxID=167968 RepID=UPI0026157407|nr:hypothetical protein [uncultured Desulfovibrio sp.]